MSPDRLRALGPPEYASALVAAVAAGWYLSALGGGLTFDEVLYARAGYALFHGNPYANPTHMFAPLGKYVIGAGELAVGTTPFGARVGVVVVALATLGVVHRAARGLGEPWAGPIAVTVLATAPWFAGYATSAMLDMPLMLTTTALAGLVLLEARSAGPGSRDIAVGVLAVLASASKAYGFVYAVGPVAAYAVLRVGGQCGPWWKTAGDRKVRPVARRVAAGAAGALVVTFLPFAFVAPPDYYGGVTLPAAVTAAFDVPFVGGVLYAFAASAYHNLTGHPEGVNPSILQVGTWVLRGGPWVLAGVLLTLGDRWLPARVRVDPWWLPAVLVVPPLVLLAVVLPKGIVRYALPIFPVVVLLAAVWIVRAGRVVAADRGVPAVAVAAVLVVGAVAPAVGFVGGVGGGGGAAHLSADSHYDDAAAVLREDARRTGDVLVVAEEAIVLWWHLGDVGVERFDFDPTAPTTFRVGDGASLTVVGISELRPHSSEHAGDLLSAGRVDYVLFSDPPHAVGGVPVTDCGERVRSWTASRPGERERYRVTLWRVEACGRAG